MALLPGGALLVRHQQADQQLRQLLQCQQHARRSGADWCEQELGSRRGRCSDIELNHCIMPSPFAAKRLSALQQLMKEYEARYGALSE